MRELVPHLPEEDTCGPPQMWAPSASRHPTSGDVYQLRIKCQVAPEREESVHAIL